MCGYSKLHLEEDPVRRFCLRQCRVESNGMIRPTFDEWEQYCRETAAILGTQFRGSSGKVCALLRSMRHVAHVAGHTTFGPERAKLDPTSTTSEPISADFSMYRPNLGQFSTDIGNIGPIASTIGQTQARIRPNRAISTKLDDLQKLGPSSTESGLGSADFGQLQSKRGLPQDAAAFGPTALGSGRESVP